MLEKLKQIFGAMETEPEGEEAGEELVLERDPVTGELREVRPEGGGQT